MSEEMAWAKFNREFHMSGTQRNPRSVIGFAAYASEQPQQFPKDFIDFAVSCGAAEAVEAPNKEEAPEDAGVEKRARKGRKSGE